MRVSLQHLILCILVGLAGPHLVYGQVSVIANPSVPIDSLDRSDLLDLYSGDKKIWSDGQPVVVLDLKPRSGLKDAFYKYLGKSSSRMKALWLKKKLSGEGDPPASFENEALLLEHLKETPGAIGFVGFSFANETVKTLLVIPPEGS